MTGKPALLRVVVFLLLGVSPYAHTQCRYQAALQQYVECKVKDKVQETMKARIGQHGEKQTEAPAISNNSTSLVDKSAAADLVSAALNLAGLSTKSNTPNTTSSTVTATAYALLAAANQKNPFDPAFYNASRDWRRISFTLGQEFPDQGSSTVPQRANVYGVKVMVVDKRDLANPTNQQFFDSLRIAAGIGGAAFGKLWLEVHDYAVREGVSDPSHIQSGDFARIQTDIDRIIDKELDNNLSAFLAVPQSLGDLVSAVRKKPQFAISFQSKVSKGTGGTNHYRCEAIYDQGLIRNLSMDTDGSFEYGDSPLVGRDSRGGRISHQFEYHWKSGKNPIVMSFAGDGSWMTNTKPAYKGQFKLSFTLLNGMEFPISATYASRTELVKESEVKGQFGFTFDFLKLASAFKPF